MKHKVKVTVLDKNCTRNCRSSIVQTPVREPAPVTMWEMSSSFIGTRNETTSGIWVLER